MSTRKLIKPAAKTSKPQPKVKSAAKPAPKSGTKTKAAAQVAATPGRTTKPVPTVVPASPAAALKPTSKQAQLLDLLRTQGATMPQMSQLTGWQAHTIRATLSAVYRKRLGLNVQSSRIEDGSRFYRVADVVGA